VSSVMSAPTTMLYHDGANGMCSVSFNGGPHSLAETTTTAQPSLLSSLNLSLSVSIPGDPAPLSSFGNSPRSVSLAPPGKEQRDLFTSLSYACTILNDQ
jgi:hypothetical protein